MHRNASNSTEKRSSQEQVRSMQSMARKKQELSTQVPSRITADSQKNQRSRMAFKTFKQQMKNMKKHTTQNQSSSDISLGKTMNPSNSSGLIYRPFTQVSQIPIVLDQQNFPNQPQIIHKDSEDRVINVHQHFN